MSLLVQLESMSLSGVRDIFNSKSLCKTIQLLVYFASIFQSDRCQPSMTALMKMLSPTQPIPMKSTFGSAVSAQPEAIKHGASKNYLLPQSFENRMHRIQCWPSAFFRLQQTRFCRDLVCSIRCPICEV